MLWEDSRRYLGELMNFRIVFCIVSAFAALLSFLFSVKGVNRRIEKGKVNEYLTETLKFTVDADMVTYGVAVTVSAVVIALFSPEGAFFSLKTVVPFTMTVFLTMAAVFDMKTWTIPNFIPLLMIFVRVICLSIDIFEKKTFTGEAVDSVVGLVICLLIPLLASLLKRGNLGGGDIKLLASVGFTLRTVPACYVMLIGLIFAIAIRYLRHILEKERKSVYFPLGPYVYLGYVAYVVFLA